MSYPIHNKFSNSLINTPLACSPNLSVYVFITCSITCVMLNLVTLLLFVSLFYSVDYIVERDMWKNFCPTCESL